MVPSWRSVQSMAVLKPGEQVGNRVSLRWFGFKAALAQEYVCGHGNCQMLRNSSA